MDTGKGLQVSSMGNGYPGAPRNPSANRPTLFVSTGCTSSDVLLAPVLAELQRRGRVGDMAGFGGAPLRDLGVRLFFDTTSISTIGPIAGLNVLLNNANKALTAYRRVDHYFRKVRPDLVILVDNSGNNLRLLKLAQRHRLRVLYYVPPELWSLWPWEVRSIVSKTTAIAPIFRSEGEAYHSYGGKVRWIGHPVIDLLSRWSRPQELNGHPPVIGLFPGSRRLEVRDLLPVLRGAAEIIHRQEPNAKFVMSAANDGAAKQIREHAKTWTVPVEVLYRQSHAVLSRCDLLLTCSGTATLEAAVLGVPMVVMYRIHHWLDRVISFVKLYNGGFPFLSLPNYLLNKPIVPELVNKDVSPERLASEALGLLRDSARRRAVSNGFTEVRQLLGPPGAILRAADLVEDLLDGRAAA